MNLTKRLVWTQVFRKGKQLLLLHYSQVDISLYSRHVALLQYITPILGHSIYDFTR